MSTSRSQSPVSACALNRLEIRGGPSPKVYESIHLKDDLALTIDAQMTSVAGSRTLILLVQCGLQRVLSIRLGDLLTPPSEAVEAISIDRQKNQISIRIQEQGYVIAADFLHNRDFSLTVCLLQKSGFSIRHHCSDTDARPPYSLENYAFPFPSESADALVPRLSSIAPPPYGASAQFPSPAIDSQHAPVPLGGSRYACAGTGWPSIPPQTDPGSSHIVANAPRLSPYDTFLNGHTLDSYRPRIRSPLRHTIDDTVAQAHQAPSHINEHPAYLSSRLVVPLSRGGAASAPRTPPAEAWPSYLRQRELASHSTPSIPEARPPVRNIPDQTRKQVANATVKDFRQLLPRPRSLPFHKPARLLENGSSSPQPASSFPEDRPTSTSPKHIEQAPQSRSPSAGTARAVPDPAAHYVPKENDCAAANRESTELRNGKLVGKRKREEPDISIRAGTRSVKSRAKAPESAMPAKKKNKEKNLSAVRSDQNPREAQAQKVDEAKGGPTKQKRGINPTRKDRNSKIRKAPSNKTSIPRHKGASKKGTPPGTTCTGSQTDSSGPPIPDTGGKETTTTILVPEHMLRQLDAISYKILDQYEADIGAEGVDSGASAQFYVDRLMAARRDFWYDALQGSEAGSLIVA